MIQTIKDFISGEDTIITSGDDLMSDNEIMIKEKYDHILQESYDKFENLSQDLKSLTEKYNTLYAQAKAIEAERNGIIIGIQVFTETIVKTLKQVGA